MGQRSDGQAGERRILGIDPVCGMNVFEKTDAIQRDHKGTTYYFCNPSCATKFDADPERFTSAPPQPG
ncbi:MAG: YHS domain-containing protein [Myxococcaceae bacterium]